MDSSHALQPPTNRDAVERLEIALDAGAIVGTWIWEIPTDRFTADARFARSFGLPLEACRTGLPLARLRPLFYDQAAG